MKYLKTVLMTAVLAGAVSHFSVASADTIHLYNGKSLADCDVKQVVGDLIYFNAPHGRSGQVNRMEVNGKTDVIRMRGYKDRNYNYIYGRLLYIDPFKIEIDTNDGRVRVSRWRVAEITVGQPKDKNPNPPIYLREGESKDTPAGQENQPVLTAPMEGSALPQINDKLLAAADSDEGEAFSMEAVEMDELGSTPPLHLRTSNPADISETEMGSAETLRLSTPPNTPDSALTGAETGAHMGSPDSVRKTASDSQGSVSNDISGTTKVRSQKDRYEIDEVPPVEPFWSNPIKPVDNPL